MSNAKLAKQQSKCCFASFASISRLERRVIKKYKAIDVSFNICPDLTSGHES